MVISNPFFRGFHARGLPRFSASPDPDKPRRPTTRNAWRPRKHWRSAHHLRRPTASTTPVASITTPIDLTANAIASAAFTSPFRQPACLLPDRMPYHLRHYHLPHRGRVGPPSSTGASGATTSNARHNSKRNETPQPTPVGKAGFEAWVLSMGGVVSVHHCRPYRNVRSHHL